MEMTSWTGNPNSKNQRWSRWTFAVETGRSIALLPSTKQMIDYSRRFFQMMFRSSVGAVRVVRKGSSFVIMLRIEGVDAHDPEVQRQVRMQFKRDFVAKGFGPRARLQTMDVAILAGSREDGSPADQLIVLPPLSLVED